MVGRGGIFGNFWTGQGAAPPGGETVQQKPMAIYPLARQLAPLRNVPSRGHCSRKCFPTARKMRPSFLRYRIFFDFWGPIPRCQKLSRSFLHCAAKGTVYN